MKRLAFFAVDFEELYQDVVLNHSRRPRHFGPLASATVHAEGDNPSCGDEIAVHIAFDDDCIREATFTGSACSICMASASLMMTRLQGMSREQAGTLFQSFHQMIVTGGAEGADLGDLAVFQVVRRFPQRVKCATLPWQTLKAALESNSP